MIKISLNEEKNVMDYANDDRNDNDSDQNLSDIYEEKYNGVMEEMPPMEVTMEDREVNSTQSRLHSYVWTHFTKLGKKGQCRYCNQLISCSSSSSNLKRHLKFRHPSVPLKRTSSKYGNGPGSPSTLAVSSTDASVSVGAASSEIHFSTAEPVSGPSFTTHPPSSSLSSQQSASSFVNVVNTDELDKHLLYMICKTYQPFSMVEDLGFNRFVKALCKHYNLPDKKTLSTTVLANLYQELFDKIKNDLIGAKAISLSSDNWTNINGINYYAVTAHFINDQNQLKSYLLECSHFYENHYAEDISIWVNSVFIKYDIQDKIVAIVSDDSSKMKSVAEILKTSHIPCFALALNLILQYAIEESIQKTVDKVKKTVRFLKSDISASSKFSEIQDDLKIDKLKLKEHVPKRWNSTYDMLSRFLLNKDPIVSCFNLLDTETFTTKITEADWKIITESVNILKVFDEATKEVSSKKTLSLSKMAVLSRLLVRHLNMFKENCKVFSKEINTLLDKLLEGLTIWFTQISNNDIIMQATLLDPRFKKQGLTESTQFQDCYENVISEMKTLVSPQFQEQVRPVSPKESSFIWQEFDERVDQLQSQNSSGCAVNFEFDQYLSETYLHRNNDPLVWWESRKLLYPTVYQLILKRLCIPATSVPGENIFSKTGQIEFELRSELTTKKITKIVFINENFN